MCLGHSQVRAGTENEMFGRRSSMQSTLGKQTGSLPGSRMLPRGRDVDEIIKAKSSCNREAPEEAAQIQKGESIHADSSILYMNAFMYLNTCIFICEYIHPHLCERVPILGVLWYRKSDSRKFQR